MRLGSSAGLGDLARDPFAIEEVAGLDAPLLVVALADAADAVADDQLAAMRGLLASVPAVTIGWLPTPPHRLNEELVQAFDVVIAPEPIVAVVGPCALAGGLSAVDELSEAVVNSPRASVTCAQLLRLSSSSPVDDALVAESLAYSTLQGGPDFARWLDSRPSPRPSTVPEPPPVRAERTGSLLRITLDRPDRRNAYNASMRDALVEALRVAVADSTLDGVVLRGAGESFCAGGDLDEFGSSPDPTSGHLVRTARSAGRWLHRLQGRIRAEVHGACVGAGIELPAFCGTLVARDDAFFELPEVAMGLVPGAGGTVSIARRIGRQRTNHLAITGRRLDARTALRWGLVDRVVAEL